MLRFFSADRRGDVAMMFGLTALALFLSIGAAVDIGRWLHARKQTIAAIDAAVLAGGRALQLNGSDVNGAIAAAQKYYTENTRSRLPVINDTVTFIATENDTAFTAQGNAFIETPILRLANIDQLPLLGTSGADYSKSKIAVGDNAGTSIEISMMLDTSGSMSGDKIDDLKDAAKDLVNIVVWDDQSQYTSKVAIAPFSGEVRLPSSWNSAARGSGLPASKDLTYTCGSKKKGFSTCTATYYLTDCVVERTGAENYTDAAPGSGSFVMAQYNASGSCVQPAADEVMALSNNKTTLTSKIDGLQIGGGTAGHTGTAWAWYLLSPNWSSLFPTDGKPAAYGTENLKKIAILMTDGEYNRQYDANGVQTGLNGAGSAANGSSVVQAKALCDGMKVKGITVYTVGFDLGGNQTAIDTLNYCATSPGHAYNAEDGDELKQSFRDIAFKISTLYLSK